MFVKVRILDAPRFLDKEYEYLLPAGLHGKVNAGCFVTVPFGGGNRHRLALVCAVSDTAEMDVAELKPVLDTATARISLSAEMLGLVEFLRETTLCATGDAVHAMIPAGAFSKITEQYRVTDTAPNAARLTTEETMLYAYVQKLGSASLEILEVRFGADTAERLRHLCRAGLLRREYVQRSGMQEKSEIYYSLTAMDDTWQSLRLGEKQRALLSLLREEGEQSGTALRAAGFTKPQFDALLKKGLLQSRSERVVRNPYAKAEGGSTLPLYFNLNDEQQGVFEKIEALATDGAPHAILLHGVTGSGKTPMMLKTIDSALARGRGVIVLLPEIALTPQTLSIFCTRYGARVAVMHSALSQGERLATYFRILSGEADVVVGTRSAVFAPVKNLGLIVMDEEHEHTYKSDMNPKYHARDVARWRCAKNAAVLLLCSATPSLESYKRAVEGRYTLLTLRTRHGGARLPEVRVVDMRREAGEGNLSPIGSELRELLSEHTARGNQSILFLNRRGYNHAVSCRSCGEAVTCPACSVTMTYHTRKGSYDSGYLLCHVCGRRLPLPEKCPSCGSVHLARLGYGTQRVEQELQELLPESRVLRMDTDTTGARFSYDEMLGAFRRHEADILLGTQMVTKGHDFPDVTLVGVLMADASLYLDDYRAAERTFSMLTQVIGRAGRAAQNGLAVIQTSNPDHEVIRLASAQDYERFYEREIRLRQLLVFPPFCDIALLTLSHSDERHLLPAAKALSEELARQVATAFADVKLVVFGPFEAPVYRVDGRYRMRMVVKCKLNKRTRELFGVLLDTFGRQRPQTPLLSVDFNPSNL